MVFESTHATPEDLCAENTADDTAVSSASVPGLRHISREWNRRAYGGGGRRLHYPTAHVHHSSEAGSLPLAR